MKNIIKSALLVVMSLTLMTVVATTMTLIRLFRHQQSSN